MKELHLFDFKGCSILVAEKICALWASKDNFNVLNIYPIYYSIQDKPEMNFNNSFYKGTLNFSLDTNISQFTKVGTILYTYIKYTINTLSYSFAALYATSITHWLAPTFPPGYCRRLRQQQFTLELGHFPIKTRTSPLKSFYIMLIELA